MKRILLGLIVVLHALAHANLVIFASASGPAWIIEPLWGVALLGYLATGLGMLRVPLLRERWKQSMIAATVASIMLLLLLRSLFGALGMALDVALLIVVLGWSQPSVDADVDIADTVGAEGLGHTWLHRIAWSAGALFFVYTAVVVGIHPIYERWGTTAAERRSPLPGDELTDVALYRVDHGITIKAPADSVWPWLAQLGQERGGFYSYAWLERLVGDHITNADRIHPEWQQVNEGDLVRAVQPDYLGGRFGDLGWRVTKVVAGRAIVLENWGAFVVQPVDSATSRFFVRTRGPGTPSFAGIVFGPLNLLVFEPAHFIMQRGMMRGIRSRAEGTQS